MRILLCILGTLAVLARAGSDKRQVTGPACVKQDIVFMLDTSSNVGIEAFLQQLEFVKSNVRYYNINPSCTRVGIVTYGSGVYNQFYLNGYSTQQSLINAIGNIQYKPNDGSARTSDAINYVTNSMFTGGNGGRTGISHYGVLVSGSTSMSPSETVTAANHARTNGITMYSVGVGKGVNQGELMGVAGQKANHAMTAQSFNALGSLAQPLATGINRAVTSSTLNSLGAPSSCLPQADIVFLVDGSGSIGASNFIKLKNFVKGIAGKLDVGPNKVHVGLMQFSNYPSREFTLNQYTTRQDVMAGIDHMNYMGGGTNTADAIKQMRLQLFAQSSGARPNVPRIGVVITDGRSSNPAQTGTEANNARSDHIGMIAIGVGNGVDVNELHAIADDPDSSNTFLVSTYDQLDAIATQLVNRACQVRATAKPVSTNTQATGTRVPETCTDKLSNCANYGPSVCSGSYAPWAKDNCQRFCGFCTPLYTTGPPPCVDHLPNCPSFQKSSCIGSYIGWAKDNCRKYCGYCDGTTQTFGFYGQCSYKGKQYKQGQRWDDGCDYECTCMDGQTGRYQCYNRCPVYNNLPAQCTLVKKDSECCLQPVCDFSPQITTFQGTQTGKTSDGIAVCVYNSHQFYQGQTWDDKCRYSCTCVNARTGLYKCHDLCPTYTAIPAFCHMEKKPGACCSKPVCEFKTSQGGFTGSGTISGNGVGISPSAGSLDCVDNIPHCDRYQTGSCDGKYRPWARDNCRKTCNLCLDNGPRPSATDFCVYQGKNFKQDDTWKIGCDNICTCENAVYGYYRCVSSCPTYNNLPSGCQEVKRAGDCCTNVQCTPGAGTFISSTNNLATIGNGGLIGVGPNPVAPTIPSGGTPAPGTGGTVYQAPTLRGCLYKGDVYIQGQTWDDGCQYSCECVSADDGLYTCRPRCPTFPSLPSECRLESDPDDECCQRPKCHFTGTPQPVYPVFAPSITSHTVVAPPIPSQLYHGTKTIQYQFTLPGHVQPPTLLPNVTGIGHCVYKGQSYIQGATWEDGCDYNCACDDASIGLYRCRQKCFVYENLPSECHLVPDPNNACCNIPKCNWTAHATSVTGLGRITFPPTTTVNQLTPSPLPNNMCAYKGHTYSQGQTWYDQCDYKCSCDDATTREVRCMRRCPEYFNVPGTCRYVPDPHDPTCCQVPWCVPTPAPGATVGPLGPSVIPTFAPGTFVGQPNGTAYIGYCEYKGVQYKQGDSWSDGCHYACICEDAAKGMYRCKEKCPTYGPLPPNCRLIPDYTEPCCMKPDCQTGVIKGQLTPAPLPGQPSPTPAPAPKFCVYKTAQYSQGQTWTDGCQYRCRCDDSSRGLYVCDQRCPTYPTLPPQCHMETNPDDSCCRQPKCNFTAIPGQLTGTLAPNMIPTKVPGVITGQANTPAPTPGPDGKYPVPQRLDFCEYKGSQYKQGATWDDGCQYTCRCIDANLGRYQCNEKCPKYTNLPPQCRLTKDAANPCCFKPVCNGQTHTQGPTLAPLPGHTVNPNPHPVTPYPTPGLPKDVCVYRDSQYTQGQQWYDGCTYKCSCEQAEHGIYRCSMRCASYTGLPPGCHLVADPQDPLCCRIPQCTPSTNSSVPYPTPPPGHITGGSVTPAPTPMPNITPQPGHTLAPHINPTPGPTPKAVCIYKGGQYNQDQRWQDGCNYNCECKDANTGSYDCTEMCAKYPNLPPQCKLVQDYLNPCCQKPVCTTLAPPGIATIAPSPGSHPTLAPQAKKMCSYNGVMFKQGQRWEDGCDLKCVCEDETTGYYRCNQRCGGVGQGVPVGCTQVTDPLDPCCRVPRCSPLTPAPSPGPALTPSPGTYTGSPTLKPVANPTPKPGATPSPTPSPTLLTLIPVRHGQGVTPTPRPGVSTVSPPLPVCVYNGKSYSQHQTWDDGCRYRCECVDAHTGQYTCSQRCPIYPNIPSYCRMVTSQTDTCCMVPDCHPPTAAPNPFTMAVTPPGVSRLVPQPTPSHRPGVSPTAGPHPTPKLAKPCVMKGVQYTKGQRWNDGCDQMCVCDDDVTGHYTCRARCKIYLSIPKECTMVPDPADPICCKVPQCIPVPGHNGNPTPGPSARPTMYTNAPHAVVTGTGTPPTMATRLTPSPRPGVPTHAPTPVPRVCVYKSQQYFPNQRWQDGCKYNCVCDDGVTGKYTCTERCGTYPNLPPQCHLQRDPNDYCCYVPVCIWITPAPTPNIPPHTDTPAPTLGPGITNVAPTPGHNPTPAPKTAFCVYQGVPFQQGQILNDGCTQKCRCDDADLNYYNCYDRCPNFPKLKPGCIMITNPKDACCQVPSCTFIPTPAPTPAHTLAPGVTPGLNPTLAPNTMPTPAPSPIPTAVPGVIISKPDPTRPPQQRGFCVYNGVKYTKGHTWDDGCSYQCECLDDMTGQYKCTERCAQYPRIPAYCVMVEDPQDRCCKIPSCPGVVPTPAPTPGSATPSSGSHVNPSPGIGTSSPVASPTPGPNPHPSVTPIPVPSPQPSPVPRDVCIMNGRAYTQGQKWYDGCRQICICDDGKTGLYSCNTRCPTYPTVQPSCIYVPAPNDPACCQIPQCNSANSTVPTPVKGTITGGSNPTPTPRPNPNPTAAPNPNGHVPTPGPGLTYPPGMVPITVAPHPGQSTLTPSPRITLAPGIQPTPGPRPKVCVYKGSQYTNGQTWRDGCQYDCNCTDAENGKYTCTDICPKYPGLAPACRMVYDPLNPCCRKPVCYTPTPAPNASPIPGVVPTPGPNPTPKADFCVYNGIPLKQGQTFADGCNKLCRCEDPLANTIVCDDRCATFPALKAGCSMVTDPNDQCCQVPACTPTNPSTNPNTTIITGVPGTITGSKVPNTGTAPVTGRRDVCLYHGVPYKTGATWDDACTYNCICIDGITGNYRCTERCARYPQVPASCSMVQDPNDVCCQKPYCPNIVPTPAPNPHHTLQPGIHPTLAPKFPGIGTNAPNPSLTNAPTPGPNGQYPTPKPRMVCVYGNQLYKQDQIWYDGCNAMCHCEDAAMGYHRCEERCARYTSAIPPTCTLVPDPKDPSCCKVVSCPIIPPSGPTPTPGYLQPNPNTPAPPVKTGLAPVPTPYPTPAPQPGVYTPAPLPGQPTPAPMPKTGCYYKGIVYQKGQQFDDGCDYRCECLDDHTGQYICRQRCAADPFTIPPECVLVQDPKDRCCKTLYCDFVNPTPFPHGIPTPAPIPGHPTPILGGTLSPKLTVPQGYCEYKGVYYTQGQQWNDGCDKKCRCEDVLKGYISCSNRCPSFGTYPSSCTLRTDPNDHCCLFPDCNSFTPRPGTGPSGTNRPPVTATSSMYTGSSGSQRTTARPIIVVPTYMPGTFTGIGIPSGPNQVITGQGTRHACVYKATVYNQGNTWDDGCSYKCECTDATRGQYRCTERCPRYINLPPQCTYQQDLNDRCCKLASCDMSVTPTPRYTPTPHPHITINPVSGTGHGGTNQPPITSHSGGFTGNGGTNVPVTLSPHPHITINPVSGTGHGGTNQPPITPTPFTGIRDKCIYKDNSIHTQGSTWQDGCSYTCVCEDPATNQYKCTARCKVFSDLPTTCTLATDPKDSCCKVPRCSGTLIPMVGGGSHTGNPTLSPSVTNVVPIGTHTTFSGTGRPSVIPGLTAQGSRSVCYYKGTVHQQGQSWDDGCDYTCTCTDAMKGLYQCISKCPNYPPIPSYCKMNKIPGMCCPTLGCSISGLGNYNPTPQLAPTPAPSPGTGNGTGTGTGTWTSVIYPSGTRPVIGGTGTYPGGGYALPSSVSYGSIKNKCIYKQRRLYNQGEKWEDGCDYSCECLDATSGYYQCKPLCATYNMPHGCYLTSSQGQCCEHPMCQYANGTTFNPLTHQSALYPVYGSYANGFGGFKPGYNMNSNYGNVGYARNRCIYKGRIYTQGQTWDDGCDYNCDCTDAQNGQYTCRQLCVTYTNLPRTCHLTSIPGQCCKVPRCSTPVHTTIATPHVHHTQHPPVVGCGDTIANCAAYGKQSCVTPYEKWAEQNCKAYCGKCSTGITPTPPACVDKLSNCAAYGTAGCTGVYEAWATDNCRKTCNLCTSTPAPSVTNAPATKPCVDKLPDCPDYGHVACISPYEGWAMINCQNTCGLCNGPTHITPTPVTFIDHTRACIYNNKVYKQGEVWQDGCQYNCTCENENTGFYRCRDLCPTWSSLPNGCTLVKPPGECCSKAMCNGVAYNTSITANTCYYGSKYYQEGETWKDACKYQCSCVDGKRGFYQCNTLCLNWGALPSVCHMDPPATGKCCQQPNCPSYVAIQFPANYTIQ